MPLLENMAISDHANESTDGIIPLKERQKKRKAKRCFCILGTVCLSIVFVAAVIILIVLMLMVGVRPPRVQTNCGVVQGHFDTKTNVFIFKGIPYAVSPTGDRRWQPPQPLDNATCWTGVMLADRFPQMCAQITGSIYRYAGSEYCLYLNIYSPDSDPLEPVPVMVYIHGGFLQIGSIREDGFIGDAQTAKELGVVIVNIQYRLNVFGWLVSHALPRSEGHTGNYGLLDQIEALRWVQTNIRNFGGDPNQVTVYGQSSGGTSVMMLLSSPLAVGLFNRAWLLSGSPIFNKTYAEAADFNHVFLNKTGCSTKKCLMNLNTSDLVHVIYPEWLVVPNSMDLPTKGFFEPALPVVDGSIIPAPTFELWDQRHPGLPDVPVMIGSTAQELDLEPTPGREIEQWTMKKLYSYVHKKLQPFDPTFPNRSLELYPVTVETAYPAEYVFTSMASDVRVNCGNEIMAHKMAAALKNKVYRYVVTSFPSEPVSYMNFDAKFAFHGWDLYGFFDTFRYVIDPNDRDLSFRDVLRENIMSFVHTGEPLDKKWTPLTEQSKAVALISDKLLVNATYNQEQCRFWNDNGFFPYSWIN